MCLEGFRSYGDSALPISSISGFFFFPLFGVWGRGIRFPLAMFSLPQELENKTVAGVFPEQSGVFKKTLNGRMLLAICTRVGHACLPAWGLHRGVWGFREGLV